MPKILKIDQLIDKISSYIHVRVDMLKADMMGQLSGIIAGVITILMVMFFMAFVCLFLSLGLASWLNALLNSVVWGYVIVAGFYGILTFIAIRLAQSGALKERIKQIFTDE
ncbi:MAG: phage holin family protein [Cyclobacteriaceae bacterium]